MQILFKILTAALLVAIIFAELIQAVLTINPCAAFKMREAYNEMVRVNCRNCDLYFHCIGNYKAVSECSGRLQHFTASLISNGREWSDQLRGRSDSGSSRNDQEANEYGRNGGNCAARYLAAKNCAYNPRTKKCKWY